MFLYATYIKDNASVRKRDGFRKLSITQPQYNEVTPYNAQQITCKNLQKQRKVIQ